MAQAEIAEYWAATLSKAEAVFCIEARKAVTNYEQNICFESMQELQFKHSILMKRFADGLERSFLEVVNVQKSGVGVQAALPVQNGITPIEYDELLETSVVENIVEEYAPLSEKQRAIFVKCLNRMLIKKYTEMPLSPFGLCHNVQCALELVSIPVERRVTILKIFAEVVLGRLSKIVEDLVTVLEQQGLSSDRSSKASELFNREIVS